MAGLRRSPACTLHDVARAAGVSTATVSRVVHGQDRVRPSTRERVLEVIEALGYIPDAAAQSMAWQRKEVIGLVTIESRSPDTEVEQEGLLFIEEVLRGVELSLSQLGWSVLISVLRDADRPGAYRRLQKISAKVDGMLIAEGIVSSEQLALLAARIPVALIAGSPDEPHADVVGADNWAGTTALARHMIEQHGKTGFDDIHLGAMFTPPLTTVRQPMRLLGERACSCLLERIADPALPRRLERLPTELVVRESCGCPHRQGQVSRTKACGPGSA